MLHFTPEPDPPQEHFGGRLTKIIVGQRGCLFFRDTDVGLAQSRLYALVDKTS